MNKKKKIILFVGIILLLIGVLYVILMNRRKKEDTSPAQAENIDYYTLMDEELGFPVSQFLEFQEASYRNQDEYEVKFIVKSDCEVELEKELSARYADDLPRNSSLYIANSAMEKEIESGNVKHIFSFFREGKVMLDDSGFHVLSVQIRICIVEIDGRQYAYIYT